MWLVWQSTYACEEGKQHKSSDNVKHEVQDPVDVRAHVVQADGPVRANAIIVFTRSRIYGDYVVLSCIVVDVQSLDIGTGMSVSGSHSENLSHAREVTVHEKP